MSTEKHLQRLEKVDAIDAVIYFADHPDDRALEKLVEIALDPDRMEDEQHYAAEACRTILGIAAFVERFAAEFAAGDPRNKELALLGVVSWAREEGQEFIDSCLDSDEPGVLRLAIGSASRVPPGQLRQFLKHDAAMVVEASRNRLEADGHETDVAEIALNQIQSDDLETVWSGVRFFAEKPSVAAAERLAEIARDTAWPEGLRERSLDAISGTRDPSTLEWVRTFFDAGDEPEKSLSARALGRYEDPGQIDRLGEFLLAPGDEFVHSQAALALGILGHDDADFYLLRGLRDERDEVRQWSADALSKLRLRDEKKAPIARELEGLLEDENAEVRGYAIRALGAIGDSDSRGVLEKLAQNGDRDAAWDAAWALADLDSPASLPAVRAVYDAVGNDVAVPVADFLERHGNDDDLERGRTMIRHEEPRGFRVLGILKSKQALPFVLEHMPPLDRPLDRIYGLGAAVRLGHGESRGFLMNMLDILPAWTAFELLHLGDERGLEVAIEAARSHYYDITCAALEALGAFGDEAAIPVLRERFEGPHDDYRRLARAALNELGQADDNLQ